MQTLSEVSAFFIETNRYCELHRTQQCSLWTALEKLALRFWDPEGNDTNI
jgi:hypothetical protein